jgi:hypothetical protein
LLEVFCLVKVEGTLEELRDLFVEGAKKEARKVAKKAGADVVKSGVKRTKSAWQRYMANKKKQIKFKSGKRKGRLDLKRMGAAFRREQRKSNR